MSDTKQPPSPSISANVRRHDGAGERDGSLIGIDLVPSE